MSHDRNFKYIDFKNIERIHPIILFSFFLLLITAIIPLLFLSPPSTSTTTFENANISGTQQITLKNQIMTVTLVIDTLNAQFQNNMTSLIMLQIDLNSLANFILQFPLANNNSRSFPYSYTQIFQLDNYLYYLPNYQIKSTIFFLTNSLLKNNFSTVIVFNSNLGHFNLPLYEKWFYITFIGSLFLYLLLLFYLKTRNPFSLKIIYKKFINQDYSKYEDFLHILNENLASILLVTPIFIIFVLLYQYYIHYSVFTNTVTFLFINISGIAVLLFLQALMILFFSLLPIFVLDIFLGDKLTMKTKLVNNLIFEPIIVFFYMCILVLIIAFPTKEIYFLNVVATFCFSMVMYFLYLRYHCWKYEYHIKNSKIITLVLVTKLCYILLLLIFLQFTGYIQIGIPYYYLLL